MMKPEAQRIAIAEACGWNSIREQDYDNGYSGDSVQQYWLGLSPDSDNFEELPKYLTDLNAMHEAEKVLTEKGVNTWWTYVDFINRHNLTPFGQSTAVHATAARRAEAFLRTIGKWEGE